MDRAPSQKVRRNGWSLRRFASRTPKALAGLLASGILGLPVGVPPADAGSAPDDRARDRGAGVATSISGLTILPGELLLFGSFERAENSGFEYSPNDFGVAGGEDFLGNLRSTEEVVFMGYGWSDAWAFGLEVAHARATFRAADEDTTGTPSEVRESGLGDVQMELTWRFQRETDERPELFAFADVAPPHDQTKPITGNADWLIHAGAGLARGFSWGTLLARFSVEYDFGSESPLDFGEWSLEWLRRFSPAWRLSAGCEGNIGGANNLDEVWAVSDLEWNFAERVALRLHGGYGLTTKTKGFSPEVGLVIHLPHA